MSTSLGSLTLACGPYFDDTGVMVSLVLFLLVKPLAYFAFIQAFRYRVSRPIPMRFGKAAGLAALRAGLGIAFGAMGIGLFLGAINSGHDETALALSWAFLYCERLLAWWIVGKFGAGLAGRRLLGWIISGTLINVAFDSAMAAGFIEGWIMPALICAAIGVFIAALHVVGRRDSLRLRFAGGSTCNGCGYDLSGNLSGRCPECGRELRSTIDDLRFGSIAPSG